MPTRTRHTYNSAGQLIATSTYQVSLEQDNGDQLAGRAALALAANATYLALASPTNAQVVAQVDKLTRETTTLIRLLTGQLDSLSGT